MFGSTMNKLYSLAVVYLTLQVAASQSCPLDVELRSPDLAETDLLAEFYRDGRRASQSLPPPGIVKPFCLPIYA